MSLWSSIGQGLSQASTQLGVDLSRAAADERSSALETQRQQRLIEFKALLESTMADRARTEQTARIDAASDKITDGKVAEKRAEIMGGMGDQSLWTAEQQAAVDQSLALDRGKIKADPKTRTEAAIATGDISPKDAAVLTQKDDALLYKALWEQSKEDGRNARSDARIAAQAEASDKRLAYLFTALEKRAEGKSKSDTAKEALQFLEGARKEVSSEEVTLRQLYQGELKGMEYDPEAKAKVEKEYAPKFADVARRRKEIQADYEALRGRVGLPARDAAPQPAPAPAPVAGGKPWEKYAKPGK